MFAGLPEGYVDLDRGHSRVIASRLELAEMVALLEGPQRGRLGDDNPTPGVVGGRGGTRRIVLPGGKAVYLRAYLRGGWARFVSRDRYFLRPPRPLLELLATEQARAAGCPVPTVLAVRIEEAGPFYRGWIVTSAIDNVLPFAEVLLQSGDRERAAALARAGKIVRQLCNAGVYHRDLTGHNLLVARDGALSVIDFDRARVDRPGLVKPAEQMRDRFWRSLVKLARQAGETLDPGARRWLDEGYEG